jgi:protein TIF31
VVKNFPTTSFMERILRDRNLIKVYNDFIEASTKGAQAIVNGNLTSLNPNDPLVSQVFVYNYIFFSFAIDIVESYRDQSAAENNPSYG